MTRFRVRFCIRFRIECERFVSDYFVFCFNSGPLQQRVRLMDFQSSATPALQTDGSSFVTQAPRNDRFVLGLPYFYEDMSMSFGHNMVRWMIIAQCGHPDKAPEVILLGMDDPSTTLGHGDISLRRQQNSQRSQQLLRRQYQNHQTSQEHYWQQYVASEVFYIPCLSKWDKLNTENSCNLQYCLLADQLYECYAQFQVFTFSCVFFYDYCTNKKCCLFSSSNLRCQ